MVERVIRGLNTVVPLAELPCIDCQDASREARIVRSCQQRDGEFVIVQHVQLKEARAFAIRLCHGFDGLGARGAEAAGQIQLFGDFGDGQLALGVANLVDADGREADRCEDLVGPDLGAGVPLVGIYQHARDDAAPV